MAGPDDFVSQAQNIAQQIGLAARALTNAFPPPTNAASPGTGGAPGTAIGTAASIIIAASTTRHGLFLHNPGTATVYIYPTGIAPVPTSTSLSGTVCFYGGGSWSLPSSEFPNVNTGWSGFTISGTGAFTVLEFA